MSQRPYGNNQRMGSHQAVQTPVGEGNQDKGGFKPFRHQKISGKESPFFTIPGSFQKRTRRQGSKHDIFQTNAERVRPNDPEAFGIGERNKQEPEIVLNSSRISIPKNRNATPTQNEHSVVTPVVTNVPI
ncbi:hypothetical protein O181_064981 [Austropuccinia psidii MF-1]|uniref:Uncharacterized protein n=1 Tax=Austropuccinia psidii MF-1 TaxID=1389203 RepID=A0A9Q3I0U3_9BASI|nr:hypothetical protein [Austropuccinia psidii MF-1]